MNQQTKSLNNDFFYFDFYYKEANVNGYILEYIKTNQIE